MNTKINQFIVCLHDVNPSFERQIVQQITCLQRLVGSTISAAIIPAKAGTSWQKAGKDFPDLLGPMDLLLHGFNHRRHFSLSCLSIGSGFSDELVGLKEIEILRRLSEGQQVMTDLFGRTAGGFLPPAWRCGALRLNNLAATQMSYLVSFGAVTSIHGHNIPLATYAWDWGPLAPLGHLGTHLGRLCQRRLMAVPVVALHPSDEQRGFLQSALDQIQRFLDQGLEPKTYKQLMENHK